jgi:hypothetical protein
MRGVIEQIWENETRNGKKYLTVRIDGERYSIWDKKNFDDLQEGKEIEYEFRQSGKYKHLTDVKPVGEEKGSAEQGELTYRPSNKDIHITRMSCLKSATEIVAPVYMDIESKQELVIELAKRFERYVFEDDLGALTQEDEGEQDAGKSG